MLGQILGFVIVVPESQGHGCICKVFIEGLLERIAFNSKTERHFYGIRMKNVSANMFLFYSYEATSRGF